MRSTREVSSKWAAHNERRAHGTRIPKASGHYGNCGYEGRFYYSYGTTVAVYLEGMGSSYVITTSQKYSQTTSRHTYYARCAACTPQFELPFLDNTKDAIEGNVQYMVNQLCDYRDNAIAKWKNWYYEDDAVRSNIFRQHTYLNNYCSLTGGRHILSDAMTILDHVMAERKRLRDDYYDPKSVARRERQRARRLAADIFTRE